MVNNSAAHRERLYFIVRIVFILAKKPSRFCQNTIFVPFFFSLHDAFDGNKRLCFPLGAYLFAVLLNVLSKSWADTSILRALRLPWGWRLYLHRQRQVSPAKTMGVMHPMDLWKCLLVWYEEWQTEMMLLPGFWLYHGKAHSWVLHGLGSLV